MRNLPSIIAVSVLTVVLLFVGVTSLVDGIAAVTADDLKFNTMAQADMEEYSYVEGEIEYVYFRFAEGYTEKSSYLFALRRITDRYYYLVECPYSPEDTMMILEVPVNTELEKKISELCYLGENATNEIQLADYAVTFSAYLECNEEEILQFAKETLEESEDFDVNEITIAPYTLNCTLKSGHESKTLPLGIICLVVALVLIILIIFSLRILQREPSYSTPYSTNRLGSQRGFAPPPRVEDYYGGTYNSNDSNAYRNNAPQTYSAYQPEFQTQQSQESQASLSQYNNSYGSGAYGSENNSDNSTYAGNSEENYFQHR